MANKRRIKPITLRESIFEQEYRLKQQAKETLKKIKENGTTVWNKENSNS
jgi:hypothetical protein